MEKGFDEKKVFIENSISPWVSYEGLGRIGIWLFDRKALCLDYTFKLYGVVLDTEILCEKHEIIEHLKKIFEQDSFRG